MNNKIVKRFAAVVLGAAVLSTCAFASEITSADYAKADAKLTYAISSTADKISYIAYAATKVADGTEGATVVDGTSYTLGEIVAVNQVDDNENGTNGTVTINEAKLSGATHVVLMSGDSNGVTVAKKAMAIDDFTYATSFINKDSLEVVVGGVTYTDCPNFKVEVTLNKAGKITGLKRVLGSDEKELTVVEGSALPSFDGTGTVTMDNVYIVGMPKDIDTTGLSIVPIVTLN